MAINVSDGGVPKRSRESCRVGESGLEGDRRRDLRDHGGPDRAVSQYSLELIQALKAEEHPIQAGSIGENLTVRARVIASGVVRVGDPVHVMPAQGAV